MKSSATKESLIVVKVIITVGWYVFLIFNHYLITLPIVINDGKVAQLEFFLVART